MGRLHIYLHEPRKKNSYFPLYWLFHRDAYNGSLSSPFNWVVKSPSLYTLNNSGFFIAHKEYHKFKPFMLGKCTIFPWHAIMGTDLGDLATPSTQQGINFYLRVGFACFFSHSCGNFFRVKLHGSKLVAKRDVSICSPPRNGDVDVKMLLVFFCCWF